MPFARAFLLDFLEPVIQFRDGLGEGFRPAILFVDVDRQEKTEKDHKDQQEEKNKIARQGKTGPFGKSPDPLVLGREDDHKDAGGEPGDGVFESHFLTADEIDHRDQDKRCHEESEYLGVH
jgi:hypothetical protein